MLDDTSLETQPWGGLPAPSGITSMTSVELAIVTAATLQAPPENSADAAGATSSYRYPSSRTGPSKDCASRIADFAGCRVWLSREAGGAALTFTGHAVSRRVATYLCQMVDCAIETLWQSHFEVLGRPKGAFNQKVVFRADTCSQIKRILKKFTLDDDAIRREKLATVDACLKSKGIVIPEYKPRPHNA